MTCNKVGESLNKTCIEFLILEQFNGEVLIVAVVKEHPILLLGGEGDGHIGGGLHVQGLELHVGGVVKEAEAGQVLAPLAAIPRGTFAHIVIRPGLVHADPVLAVVLLARRGLTNKKRVLRGLTNEKRVLPGGRDARPSALSRKTCRCTLADTRKCTYLPRLYTCLHSDQ